MRKNKKGNITIIEKIKDKFAPLLIVFCLGILIIKGIKLYRVTFIDWYLLLIPIILMPIILYFIVIVLFQKSGDSTSKIMTFIFVAPLSFYLFLAVNFYFCNTENFSERLFKIEKKGEAIAKRSHSPFAIINYENIRKQLFFSQEEREILYASKNVKLEIHKGLLGFEVIRKHTFPPLSQVCPQP